MKRKAARNRHRQPDLSQPVRCSGDQESPCLVSHGDQVREVLLKESMMEEWQSFTEAEWYALGLETQRVLLAVMRRYRAAMHHHTAAMHHHTDVLLRKLWVLEQQNEHGRSSALLGRLSNQLMEAKRRKQIAARAEHVARQDYERAMRRARACLQHAGCEQAVALQVVEQGEYPCQDCGPTWSETG